MRCRSFIPALAAVALCMTLGSPAGAQGRRGGGMPRSRPMPAPKSGNINRGARTPIEEFETMPPEQQRRELDRLPPQQRERLQERLERFNQLPLERQQALKNLYNRLHELPPDRQNAVRQSINKFSQMPPERQEAIRGELRNMAGIPPDKRKAYMSTSEFRGKFNKKEQETLRDMSEVLPPQ